MSMLLGGEEESEFVEMDGMMIHRKAIKILVEGKFEKKEQDNDKPMVLGGSE